MRTWLGIPGVVVLAAAAELTGIGCGRVAGVQQPDAAQPLDVSVSSGGTVAGGSGGVSSGGMIGTVLGGSGGSGAGGVTGGGTAGAGSGGTAAGGTSGAVGGGGTGTGGTVAGGGGGTVAGGTAGTSCNGDATSNLPGVFIEFPEGDRCSYTQSELAAGVTLNFEVRIEQSLDGVHPVPPDLGGCGQPDASGLIVGFEIAGNTGDRYCLCDVGPCMRQTFSTRTVAGTYPNTIRWDGRNWQGPSDTGNREGAAFPPGTYTLTVTAKGTRDGPGSCEASVCSVDAAAVLGYQVVSRRFITITP